MRVWPVLILAPLLAGCTDSDWNRMLRFGDSDQARREPVAVTAAAPAPTAAPRPAAPAATAAPATVAAAQMDPFCLGIARQDATTQDFDTGTQQKVAARSYQQCVRIFGGAN